MSLKKNAVSYVAWMIILLFAGAAFSFLGMTAANTFHVNVFLAVAGYVIFFFGILFLVYLLTGYIVGLCHTKIPSMAMTKAAPIIEGIVVFVCLIAGVALRICLLPMAGEEAAYYEVSKVTDQGSILVQSVQGSVFYYCMLLHGLFLIVGNHWIAGIWLQIILQAVGAVIIYFAIKRLTNRWPALLVLFYILFAPTSVEAGLTYSPQMLYFCLFALVLFFVADYLKRSSEEENLPVAMWCYTVFVGVMIGVCCYVDVTGCLLFLPVLCLPMVDRMPGHSVLWFLRGGVLIVFAVGAFCLSLFADALLSGSSFLRVLNAWLVTYGSVGANFKFIASNANVDIVVVIILISFGTFSFWRRKTVERFTPFVLLCAGVALMHFLGITTDNMSGSYLLCVLYAALAAVCTTELFAAKQPGRLPEKRETETVVSDRIQVNKKQEEKSPAAESEPQEAPACAINFIENPLPVPKKHIKKIMDYAIETDESNSDYDISVPDTDDYDY